MTRGQRRAHARIFLALVPLLTAALIYALGLRTRTARVLRTAAITSPSSSEPAP